VLGRVAIVFLGILSGLATLAACRATHAEPALVDAGGPSLFGGGGGGGVDPYDPDAALPERVEALFTSCTGGPENVCHGSGAAGLTLRLGPDGDVVGVPSTERPDLLRVRPYAPSASYLYLKVLGDGGIEGGRMPLDGDFEARRVDLIQQWIQSGAASPR
jgi:hypothetical protein